MLVRSLLFPFCSFQKPCPMTFAFNMAIHMAVALRIADFWFCAGRLSSADTYRSFSAEWVCPFRKSLAVIKVPPFAKTFYCRVMKTRAKINEPTALKNPLNEIMCIEDINKQFSPFYIVLDVFRWTVKRLQKYKFPTSDFVSRNEFSHRKETLETFLKLNLTLQTRVPCQSKRRRLEIQSLERNHFLFDCCNHWHLSLHRGSGIL